MGHLASIEAAYVACQWLQSNRRKGSALTPEAQQTLREHGWPQAGADDVVCAIEYAQREVPLSFLVRSEWHDANLSGKAEPAEFELLLSTGGPALRLRGDLTESYGACSVALQHQDWDTPWQDVKGLSRRQAEALEWFAELFTLCMPY